jgi:hypothetical protein
VVAADGDESSVGTEHTHLHVQREAINTSSGSLGDSLERGLRELQTLTRATSFAATAHERRLLLVGRALAWVQRSLGSEEGLIACHMRDTVPEKYACARQLLRGGTCLDVQSICKHLERVKSASKKAKASDGTALGDIMAGLKTMADVNNLCKLRNHFSHKSPDIAKQVKPGMLAAASVARALLVLDTTKLDECATLLSGLDAVDRTLVVLGGKSTRTRLGLSARWDIPLHGRHDVLARLLEHVRERHTLVLTGPPGVGKSALLRQLAREVEALVEGPKHVAWVPGLSLQVFEVKCRGV